MEKLTGLNIFAREIHENAIIHGFCSPSPSFGEFIALCHSELSEALEAYRNNLPFAYVEQLDYKTGQTIMQTDIRKWNNNKPEGIAVELADCIIRILDWCALNDIDIENILLEKHKYNKMREYRHGGKLL